MPVEKVAKRKPYLHCFQIQGYFVYVFILNGIIYLQDVPSLHHKRHAMLFILTFFYLKQNI